MSDWEVLGTVWFKGFKILHTFRVFSDCLYSYSLMPFAEHIWTIVLGPLLSRTVYAYCLTEMYMIGGSNSYQPSPLHQPDYFPYLSLLRSKNALKLSSFPSVPLSFGMCLMKWWLYLQLVLFITLLLPEVQAWFISVQSVNDQNIRMHKSFVFFKGILIYV